MKLVLKKKSSPKQRIRTKKKVQIRKKISGTLERPRLVVFRSSKHIYAQVVDDAAGKTLASYSSLKIDGKQPGLEQAKLVGAGIAKLAKEKNIEAVVFDRSGYLYHGRIQAVAEAAREAGLNF